MANYELVVPKLGESVIEATITKWLKQVGDTINEDDTVVEIATDKVDSEIPSVVSGKLVKKLFNEGDTVAVGAVFAIIETNSSVQPLIDKPVSVEGESLKHVTEPAIGSLPANPEPAGQAVREWKPETDEPSGVRFYSPLVRSIARQENISFTELDSINGSGKDDRITKQDLLNYIETRKTSLKPAQAPVSANASVEPETNLLPAPVIQQVLPGESRIVEMNRIRQLIANHMVKSVQTSPHVTSFMEVDMSNIVKWRDKNKDIFQKRENEKLTFTPIFIEAIAKSVRDFPLVNVSVDGAKIMVHKNVNIGMAVALPNFNLIVPVVRNAHEKSLLGIVKTVNDLAERARKGKLVPDEINGGTISMTNLGSFGTLMGTPIINQPQTAIVAVGAIKKRVVVIESPDGDTIGIRPIMMISVTYDHRVIDGALGGQFLARLVQYLETFDTNQPI
ncbi:MAG: dihydrolipoamide acetyltransferase family protein [Bacteroidetes bacterium]|nr:dihydrolipoamide acetyltransferase family protein [Bacteroidota bacterium]